MKNRKKKISEHSCLQRNLTLSGDNILLLGIISIKRLVLMTKLRQEIAFKRGQKVKNPNHSSNIELNIEIQEESEFSWPDQKLLLKMKEKPQEKL